MRDFRGGCLILAIVSCSPTAEVESYASRPARLAFVNAIVVDPASGVARPGRTVVVERGRITAVGSSDSLELIPGTTIVDASGRYLMPGLIDAHVHHFEEGYGYDERELLLYLAKGVTTVRIMRGSGRALRARDDIRRGLLIGPRLVVCSPYVDRGSGGSSPDSARAAVRRHAAEGYDCIKIYTGPKADAFAAVVTEAGSLGIPTAGHAGTRLPFDQILRLGSIEHIEEIQWFFGRRPDIVGADDLSRADSIAQRRVPIVTTIGGFDFRPYFSDSGYARLLARESSRYVPRKWMRERGRQLKERRKRGQDLDSLSRSFGDMYERALRYAKRFQERDVLLVFGTDAGNALHAPGFAAVLELEALVTAGLSPAEALATATTHAADALRIDAGRVEPGRAADLVLLRANPLTNVANVAEVDGVLAGTRWLDSRAIEAILVLLRKR